jgi:hypothetical protein
MMDAIANLLDKQMALPPTRTPEKSGDLIHLVNSAAPVNGGPAKDR